MNMSNKDNQWSYKDIIKGKTLPFIILTIISSYIIKVFVEKLLNYFMNMNNESIYQYNYSFRNLTFIFVIFGAFFSIWIIKKTIKIKGVNSTVSDSKFSSYSEEREINQKKQFKWYSFYGIAIGYLFLIIIFNLLGKLTQIMIANNAYNEHSFLIAFAYITLTISSCLLLIIGVKSLNKIMIKITHTNELLLLDINKGIYDSSFSSSAQKSEIIKLLEKGTVSSLKGASIYIQLQKILKGIGKASMFVATIIFFITFGTMNFLTKDSRFSSVGGNVGFMTSSESLNKNKKRKEEAQWNAKQRQKEADYAWKHAGKQARYNPNTHYMNERLNRAKQKQKKANEAERFSKKF